MELFESHKARVAHEVHALSWGGTTEAVRHDDDDFQRMSDVRNSFPELGNSAKSCGTSFSMWKVLVKRSTGACDWEEKVS